MDALAGSPLSIARAGKRRRKDAGAAGQRSDPGCVFETVVKVDWETNGGRAGEVVLHSRGGHAAKGPVGTIVKDQQRHCE